MGKRLDDEERRAIEDAIRAGTPRNEIAREFKRSPSTVTGIANDAKLSFDRSETKNATQARTADMADLRSQLSMRLLRAANDELDRLEYVDAPSGRRDTWVAVGIAIDKHMTVAATSSGDGETPDWLSNAAAEIRKIRQERAG